MLIDLHQDLYLYDYQPDFYPDSNQVSPDQIRQLDTDIVIASGFCGPNSIVEFGVSELQMWEQALEYYQGLDDFYLIKSWSDYQKNRNTGTGIIFHLEGIYHDISYDELDDWYEKGLRSIGLTWAESSPYAGGNKYPDQGLTNRGRGVIEWCVDREVLIDLAHMSETAFFETVETIDFPLLVSHANAKVICNHGQDRNLSDRQLLAVGESGGVVGIFFARSFVNSPIADIEDVMRHIKHMVDIAGEDSVAIGSDFGGIISQPKITGLEQFTDLHEFKVAIEDQFSSNFADKMFYQNAERLISSYI